MIRNKFWSGGIFYRHTIVSGIFLLQYPAITYSSLDLNSIMWGVQPKLEKLDHVINTRIQELIELTNV